MTRPAAVRPSPMSPLHAAGRLGPPPQPDLSARAALDVGDPGRADPLFGTLTVAGQPEGERTRNG